jgi:hypothetical protein
MLNSPEAYQHTGAAAGQFSKKKAHVNSIEEMLFFKRMRAMEKPEDRPKVTKLFEDAYRSATK